jgi:hypothetical protein
MGKRISVSKVIIYDRKRIFVFQGDRIRQETDFGFHNISGKSAVRLNNFPVPENLLGNRNKFPSSHRNPILV